MRRSRPHRPRGRRPLAGLLAGVLAVLVGVTAAGSAAGDDLDDQQSQLEQRQQANDQQRADAEAALEGLSEELAQTAQELLAVQQQLGPAREALSAAEEALAGYEREAALIAARLQDAQDQQASISATIEQDSARADEIRSQIGQLARQAYQGGPELSGLSVVMEAQSVEEFTEQYSLATAAQRAQSEVLDELAAISADNRNSQARLTAVGDRIAELKDEADAKVAQAEAARQEAADREAEVERLVAEQTAKKKQIEQQKSAAQAEVDQIDAEAAAIRKKLEQVAAQQRERAAAAAAAAGTAPPPAPSGTVSGALFGNPTSISPIYVTSEYGMRLHPILGYYRLHAGIDLRTWCGTPIYAAKEGTVQWAQWRNGFGNQVMVDHGLVDGNSLMTSYNHMTSFVVGGGQAVSRGQLLGYSGNTGTSAACHLHFEVYVNGATVNPRPLLGL
ncbi:M23 family metallopeptidase [Cellulomonas sp. C5510]|uniref:M23 family metallopeptidase n=1 Tax=Cellulomonas sp. C5510 TaxID=2871170 RepID=UPI001C94601F|nr:M23 family metallopeptidase [Cellulomonas sp. C5510]QZN84698.1 peptidoglycan DD-metalloendopeptidase family protein [Cellulomonas sp. C5510]